MGLSSECSGVVERTAFATHGSCVRERLRRPDIVRQCLFKLRERGGNSVRFHPTEQGAREGIVVHTFASLSAACCPDIDEV